jgi:hypothetical protein
VVGSGATKPAARDFPRKATPSSDPRRTTSCYGSAGSSPSESGQALPNSSQLVSNWPHSGQSTLTVVGPLTVIPDRFPQREHGAE